MSRTKYKVVITETLKKVIEVEADGPQQAEQFVTDGWRDGEFVLGAEEFVGVEFVVATPDPVSASRCLSVHR